MYCIYCIICHMSCHTRTKSPLYVMSSELIRTTMQGFLETANYPRHHVQRRHSDIWYYELLLMENICHQENLERVYELSLQMWKVLCISLKQSHLLFFSVAKQVTHTHKKKRKRKRSRTQEIQNTTWEALLQATSIKPKCNLLTASL